MAIRYLVSTLAALCAAVASTSPAQADPRSYASGAQHGMLVELFTSEGCSSCPPADRWLSGLRDDPRLWRQLIPVAFHVDYWDAIGWPDRFARAEFSQRQRDYARQGHIGSVYTPGFVAGGREWRGWFRDPALRIAPGSEAGELLLETEGERFRAAFTPRAGSAELPDELHVARLGFELETEVRAGENRGRTLRHDFVVLGHLVQPLRDTGGTLTAEGALPEPVVPAARYAVAAWVARGGDPTPLQAVGGWLSE